MVTPTKRGMAVSDHPIDVRADYPEHSSRGWATRAILPITFLALIPHFFILILLAISQFFVALIAQVAVAVDGEYPPGMFDFVAGYRRWQTRVNGYAPGLSAATRRSALNGRSRRRSRRLVTSRSGDRR